MKHKLIALLGACMAWLFVSTIPVCAQANPSQCVSKITERLQALGQAAEFDFLKAREIMKQFDYGEISAAVADPGKAAAFKKTFTSLSEFCDLCGASLSAKGMKGYTKQSGMLMNSAEPTKSTANIAMLKEGFTKSGTFKSADFDGVMSKLGDETKFDFDGTTTTFTSKCSGVKAKYSKHPQGSYFRDPQSGSGGEPDAITHIMRGHTKNELTDGLIPKKSIFDNATEVFELIDEALNVPSTGRNNLGNGAFWVDLGRTIGTDAGGFPTSKVRIVLRSGTTDVIHTAFPH